MKPDSSSLVELAINEAFVFVKKLVWGMALALLYGEDEHQGWKRRRQML